MTVRADGVHDREVVGAAGGKVVGAECGCLVDESGAIVRSDVVSKDDEVCVGDVDVIERSNVVNVLKFTPGHAAQDGCAVAHIRRHEFLGHNDVFAFGSAHDCISRIRLRCHSRVGDQGPGCRRPHQK